MAAEKKRKGNIIADTVTFLQKQASIIIKNKEMGAL